MAKFDAVLFDLDGTLLNTIEDLADSSNYMLRKFGYPEHSYDEYKYMVGNGMRKLMERALPENHKSESDIDRAMEIFMPYYEEHSLDKTRPYNEIEQLLCELKARGLKRAVITNKAASAAESIIAKLLPDRFDIVYGQHEGVPTKPDPTSTLCVMKKLGVEPDRCIFIGDSGVDMQTAKNSGAYAAGALWGFRTEDELVSNGADALIHSPLLLLKIL